MDVRLFVGGLKDDCAVSDFLKRLGTFGTVSHVDRPAPKCFQDTRSFAYFALSFRDENALRKCLTLYNGTKWRGCKLRVERAKPDFRAQLAAERDAESDLEVAPHGQAGPGVATDTQQLPQAQFPINLPRPCKKRKVLTVPEHGTGSKKSHFPPVKAFPIQALWPPAGLEPPAQCQYTRWKMDSQARSCASAYQHHSAQPLSASRSENEESPMAGPLPRALATSSARHNAAAALSPTRGVSGAEQPAEHMQQDMGAGAATYAAAVPIGRCLAADQHGTAPRSHHVQRVGPRQVPGSQCFGQLPAGHLQLLGRLAQANQWQQDGPVQPGQAREEQGQQSRQHTHEEQQQKGLHAMQMQSGPVVMSATSPTFTAGTKEASRRSSTECRKVVWQVLREQQQLKQADRRREHELLAHMQHVVGDDAHCGGHAGEQESAGVVEFLSDEECDAAQQGRNVRSTCDAAGAADLSRFASEDD